MFRSSILTITLGMLATSTALAQVPRVSTLQWPTAATAHASQQPHPAVVRIYVSEGKSQSIGSGTLIDARAQYGLVITNWHVIRDAQGPISVVFPDGFQSLGRVVHADQDWDLAAVSIWRPQVAPVAVALEQPRPGEMLTIAGYGSEGKYRAISGKCTQYLAPSEKHPYELVELAAAARQGDSGGPIFNARGELAGVLFGSVKGTTAGSYGGRVWKFVEPLLQPNANISAPDHPPANNGSLAVSTSAPPLIADPERPSFVASPAEVTPASTKTAAGSKSAPLEPITSEVAAEIAPDLPTAENAQGYMHTPFPYRAEQPATAGIAMPHLGFNANNPTLQTFLGHTPIEQAKAIFAVIGMFTVLAWLWRWNQTSPAPVVKK